MEPIFIPRATILWTSIFCPTKVMAEDKPKYRASIVLPRIMVVPPWMDAKDVGGKYGLEEGTLVVNAQSYKPFPVFGVPEDVQTYMRSTMQKIDSLLHGHPADVILRPVHARSDWKHDKARLFVDLVSLNFAYGIGEPKTFETFREENK